MMPSEDIAGLEPGAESTSAAPDAPATARPLRGHHAKIAEAVTALRAGGKLPPNLRAAERDRRIISWLIKAGYGSDLPSRDAIRRYFERLG